MKILKNIFLFIIILNCATTFSQTRADEIANLIKNNKYEKALSLLEKSTIDKMDYNKYKGFIYYELYNPDSTVYYLEKFYRNNNQDDDVSIKLSQALLWKKNFKDASTILEQVKNKNNLEYLKVLASKNELLGDYKQAVILYDQVIKKEKLPYGTMERKAILLSWMKQFDASVDLFDKIIKTKIVSEPLRTRCKIKKAEVLSWKNEFDEAIIILDDLLKNYEKNIPARFVKAQILEWMGEYKEAKDLYKEVLLIDPKNNESKLKLEKLLWVK